MLKKVDICLDKNIKGKIPDIINLATKTTLTAKVNKVKGEIPNITNLATTSALTAVESILLNFMIFCVIVRFKFTKETFDLRLKRIHLASQSNVANFVNKTL